MQETTDKLISYLFKEEYLKNFIDYNYIKFVESKKHKEFILTLIKFYIKFDKIPNIDEYEKFVKPNDGYKEYVIMFQTLMKKHVAESFSFLVDHLRNEYQKEQLSRIISDIDYKNVDLSSISAQINSIMTDVDFNTDVKERFIHDAVIERWQILKRGGIKFGIDSGFKTFNDCTGGLNKKELYLFFGRSGIGKTRVLFNFAYNLCIQNYFGMFFSLEMYIEQMERIFDSRLGGISAQDIKYAKVDKNVYKNVLKQIKEKKFPLYIVEHAGATTIEFIINKIRDFKKKYPLDFVVIDYLTLMRTGLNLQRDEEYGVIAKELKNLAKKEDVILITAAQANRKSVESTKDVGLENIGYSDQIAQNSDFVAYIQRGKLHDQMLDIKVIKNREGETQKIMKFYIDFSTNLMRDTLNFTIGGK